MTIVRVSRTQSAANLAKGGALYELTAQFNSLAEKFEALLQKLDTDFTAQNGVVTGSQLDTDYEATVGEAKAVDFRETGAPVAS